MMNPIESQHPDKCTSCKLCETRNLVVHSVLIPNSRVLFVAEAPGADEDKTGKPLVGRQGEIFNEILYDAGLNRSDVSIANTVSCRPPENRKPERTEIESCFQYLDAEIRLLKPEIIVLLGGTSIRKFLPGVTGVASVRGNWFVSEEYDCKILPTYHPAATFHDPTVRSKMLSDFRKVAEMLTGGRGANLISVSHHVVSNQKQFDWLIENLHKQELWAFDTETTGYNFLTNEIFMMSFSWKMYTAVLLDLRKLDEIGITKEYMWSKLKEVFANQSKKIMQNGKFDIKFLMRLGITVKNFYADTMFMHYLLDENSKHDLGTLAWQYSDRGGYEIRLETYVLQNKKAGEDFDYATIPDDLLYPYALMDADVTLRAFHRMLPEIEKQQLTFTLFHIMMPVQRMLIMTEYHGVIVDRPYLDSLLVKYNKEIDEQMGRALTDPTVVKYIEEKSEEMLVSLQERYEKSRVFPKRYPTFDKFVKSREEKDRRFIFNPKSTKQMRELLFERMKLKPFKFTKKGKDFTENPSADAESLEHYAKKNSFCAYLARARKLIHLRDLFLIGVRDLIGVDGRLHTSYLLTGTKTGRISSRGPNLNNIPRTMTASDIKDMFIAEPGHWLVEIDGKAMEFRVWASMSRDERMIRDIHLGLDIHKAMAGVAYYGRSLPVSGDISKEQFDALTKDVTKEQRQSAKTEVVFGPMYGRGPDAIAAALGITKTEAKRVQNELFKRYKKAKAFLSHTVDVCKKDKYVKGLFGRRRHLPEIDSRESGKRAEAERQGPNSVVQGTSSDITFLAGLRIMAHFWQRKMKTRLFFTVYDSLVYNVPEDELEYVVKYITQEFIKPLPLLNVQLGVEAKVGKRWGSGVDVDYEKDWNSEFSHVREVVEKKEAEISEFKSVA